MLSEKSADYNIVSSSKFTKATTFLLVIIFVSGIATASASVNIVNWDEGELNERDGDVTIEVQSSNDLDEEEIEEDPERELLNTQISIEDGEGNSDQETIDGEILDGGESRTVQETFDTSEFEDQEWSLQATDTWEEKEVTYTEGDEEEEDDDSDLLPTTYSGQIDIQSADEFNFDIQIVDPTEHKFIDTDDKFLEVEAEIYYEGIPNADAEITLSVEDNSEQEQLMLESGDTKTSNLLIDIQDVSLEGSSFEASSQVEKPEAELEDSSTETIDLTPVTVDEDIEIIEPQEGDQYAETIDFEFEVGIEGDQDGDYQFERTVDALSIQRGFDTIHELELGETIQTGTGFNEDVDIDVSDEEQGVEDMNIIFDWSHELQDGSEETYQEQEYVEDVVIDEMVDEEYETDIISVEYDLENEETTVEITNENLGAESRTLEEMDFVIREEGFTRHTENINMQDNLDDPDYEPDDPRTHDITIQGVLNPETHTVEAEAEWETGQASTDSLEFAPYTDDEEDTTSLEEDDDTDEETDDGDDNGDESDDESDETGNENSESIYLDDSSDDESDETGNGDSDETGNGDSDEDTAEECPEGYKYDEENRVCIEDSATGSHNLTQMNISETPTWLITALIAFLSIQVYWWK